MWSLKQVRASLAGVPRPVFSEEASLASKSRRYVTCDGVTAYGEALSRRKPSDRRSHELLFPGVPVRLFFDIDCDGSAAEADAAVAAVHGASASVVAGERLVFDGSREGKQSRHVVYPDTVFRDLASLAAFVSELRLPASADMQVYSAYRTFRTPYSTGLGKVTAMGGDDFDIHRFERGLVMAWKWNGAFVDSVTTAPKRVRPHSLAMSGWSDEEVDVVANEIELGLDPTYVVKSISRDGRGIHFILGGVACARKGCAHLQNNVYLHVHLPAKPPKGFVSRLEMHGLYACPDVDCESYSWYAGDFSRALEAAARVPQR